MRFIQFVIAALSGASAAIARPACNADNCARAVTGTAAQPALSVRQSGCSSYQTATTYPAAETVTYYNYYFGDSTVFPAGPTETLVQQTMVPAYASKPCGSAASRYASACSCAGITATTVTAAVETVKVYTSAPDPSSECHSGDRQGCAGEACVYAGAFCTMNQCVQKQ
ncbi:unnamed protein product [Aureobasidium uvarum]|uniref:Uncharacterized protein n=1 Tax=Aureobasidium uvarum TaxID=2773716 RepID=A0A9N8PQW1_9PEZI|nr:unnamed protein product [Aureobasidium uvarum]